MEIVIAVVIGMWFSLAGIASSIAVIKSFEEKEGLK